MYFPIKQNHTESAQTFGRFQLSSFVVPLIAILIVATLLLGGCQSALPTTGEAPAASVQEPTQASSAPPVAADETTAQEAVSATVAGEVSTELPAASAEGSVATATDDAAESSGSPPMRLAIPAIDFVAQVEPMAWRVTEVEGTRQAVWEVPESSAGWHINSATPGTAGNMLLSGHHLVGTAVFAPLARGEVALDDEILVTDASGKTFVYQVSAVADPIPVSGATEAERQRMDDYYAPAGQAKLTLITGWPDFSDTHYLFITADFVGELE